jgi:uncharacterized protein YecE (DUF72 family)
MMDGPGDIRIGISGWRYKPWRGAFYPEGLRQKDELAFAAKTFRTLEINGTFYGLQRPRSFATWAAETPDDFVFSVKAPRYITHIRRLREIETPVANFLASGVLELGAKLGPMLWQFPASFSFDPAELERFLALLPHDTEAAVEQARGHDDRMVGRSTLQTDMKRRLRHAVEVRHQSFAVPEFIDLLRCYDVALVCADTVDWPRFMDLTSDFVYCRLHGSEALYESGYDDVSLERWTERVAVWAKGAEPVDAERVIDRPGPQLVARDAFIYFDNTMKTRAPVDALALEGKVKDRLGRDAGGLTKAS